MTATTLADLVICTYCGGETDRRSTCPKAIPCPRCGVKEGQKCKRPSGHRAAATHKDRIRAAEILDRIAGLFT